jgi:hypothetical protein
MADVFAATAHSVVGGGLTMFLTPDEVATLTGSVQPAAQKRWLRNHGWEFVVNLRKHPIVAVAEAQRYLVGGAKKSAAAQQPNWGALDGTQA